MRVGGFFFIVSEGEEKMHTFQDKNRAMTKVQTLLKKDVDTSLVEVGLSEGEFHINQVSWKEIAMHLMGRNP